MRVGSQNVMILHIGFVVLNLECIGNAHEYTIMVYKSLRLLLLSTYYMIGQVRYKRPTVFSSITVKSRNFLG